MPWVDKGSLLKKKNVQRSLLELWKGNTDVITLFYLGYIFILPDYRIFNFLSLSYPPICPSVLLSDM